MSFSFKQKPVAVIKGKSATSTDTFTINGVNASCSSATDAATQINKILGICGKAIAGDENMTLTQVKEAVEDE